MNQIDRTPTRRVHAGPRLSRALLALSGALLGLSLSACAADSSDDANGELAEQAAVECPTPGTRPPAATLNFPVTEEFPKLDPGFKIHRPTDLTVTGEKLPVVVWANGGCFRSSFTWKPLYQRWAAAGFVVLALDAKPGDFWGELGTASKEDQGKLIDWILKQNETQGSPYFGRIDTKRVVAAGNSCGGVTSLQLAARDPRVAAVFVLSGSSAVGAVDQNAMKAIKVPVGYIVGGKEDIAGANATGDYAALTAGVPALIVRRSTGDHITVSTTPEILAEEAKMSLDWLDLALYGTPSALATLRSPTVCTGCQAGIWSIESKNLETLTR